MSWSLRSLFTTDALMEYEARLGYLLRLLIGDTVVENPDYVSPMAFLKDLLARGSRPLQGAQDTA